MKFDFKVINWERITVPKEYEEEILAKIKEGTITSSNDICRQYPDIDVFNQDLCMAEQLSVEENKGNMTIEVLNDLSETIYSNAES